MARIVKKFGGTSVADLDRIRNVATKVKRAVDAGDQVVVVVSAMGDSTDELLDLAEQVSPLPPARELDMLLSSGERISMALLAMAIHSMGFKVTPMPSQMLMPTKKITAGAIMNAFLWSSTQRSVGT